MLESYSTGDDLDFDKLYSDLYEYVNNKDLDSKLKFIFRVYDSDNDGLFTKVDLFNVLKNYTDCKSDKVLTDIVNQTFNEAGLYTEKIDYEVFKRMIIDKSKNMEKLLGY